MVLLLGLRLALASLGRVGGSGGLCGLLRGLDGGADRHDLPWPHPPAPAATTHAAPGSDRAGRGRRLGGAACTSTAAASGAAAALLMLLLLLLWAARPLPLVPLPWGAGKRGGGERLGERRRRGAAAHELVVLLRREEEERLEAARVVVAAAPPSASSQARGPAA